MYREIFAASYVAMGALILYFVRPYDERKHSSLLMAFSLFATGIAAFAVPEGLIFATLWATLIMQPIFAIILLALLEPKEMYVPFTVGLLAASMPFLLLSKVTDSLTYAVLGFIYVTLATWFALRDLRAAPLLPVYAVLAVLSKLYGNPYTFIIEGIMLLMGYSALVLKALEGSGFSGKYKRFELKRKAFHFAAFIAVIPLVTDIEPLIRTGFNGLKGINEELASQLLMVSPIKVGAIIIFGSIIPMFILIEAIRIITGISLIPVRLLRDAEKRSFASYMFSMQAILLVGMLFDWQIIMLSILVGLLADAASAIVGVRFGKHKITWNRSLEGTVAGWLTAVLILAPFVPMQVAAVIATTLSLFDVSNVIDLNDNLVFPVLTAVLLFAL